MTAFVVDQRKAVGLKEVKPIGKPILVIAPYLTTALEEKSYLLVRGQLVSFDPAVVARVAPDYRFDLPPEVGARYHGSRSSWRRQSSTPPSTSWRRNRCRRRARRKCR